MQKMSILIGLILIRPAFASSLVFKKELVANPHWVPYGIVLLILFIVLFILARYSKKNGRIHSEFKVIDKLIVNNKTNIFIIDYQGERILLADNQNALAIHTLSRN